MEFSINYFEHFCVDHSVSQKLKFDTGFYSVPVITNENDVFDRNFIIIHEFSVSANS